MSSPLNFQLEQYEGPLDLLLDLIRKQQINIYDIPIARITAQYMDYMNRAAALDMELGAEFVYMAATLIHIKSKMLLPRDPELEKIAPEEDPRTELVERLLEHEKYKNAAEMLQQKRMVEEAAWSNPRMREFISEDEGPGLAVTIFDLVQTFQTVLERAKNRPTYDVARDDVTVPDMIRFVRSVLERAPRSKKISVLELFDQQRSRRAMICLFLALLELVRRQAVALEQTDAFGDIAVRRSATFSEAFQTEQTEPVQEEYK
ncbi:MAG TPA: segregation/condensation protein A [Bryobacteraceae bacterium]|nr:segregation/condensation protein A [Bryobacteraceae bacterium]